MYSKLYASLALVGAIIFAVPAFAQDHNHHEDSQAVAANDTHDHTDPEGGHDVKGQIKETIEHHLADSYESKGCGGANCRT